jgi:uncharacterized protein
MSIPEPGPIAWFPKDTILPVKDTTPFYTFLFKIASRCNLDCTYCYVYSGPDQSWRDRPKFMSEQVASDAANAIAAHVRKHNLNQISVIFHGGEPLLAGAERLDKYCTLLSATVPAKIEFAIQTNGTLLTKALLHVFAKYQIRVGISLDGDPIINDRNRKFRNGRGSYARVASGLELLRGSTECAHLFGGILAVIDLRNDPADVYASLAALKVRSFDVLLPDCNHDAPAYRPDGPDASVAYGKWMSDFFDIWLRGDQDIEIRYFEEYISLVLGGDSSLESIGAKTVDLIVIEADGEIEGVDTLKMVGRHVTHLGLNVSKNTLDEAKLHPAIFSRMLGYNALCDTCRACPDLHQCGGGYLPHRYSRENGFLNPSIYCDDIRYFIAHIRHRLADSVPQAKSNLVAS